MQSLQEPTQAERIQSAPYQRHLGWKRIIGTIIVVALLLVAIVVAAFPVARISVTVHNSVGDTVFACIFIDHHNKTGLHLSPGEEIESAWQVTAGTHRVQIYYYFENYPSMNGLAYSVPHKVEAFSTWRIQTATA